ncbi:RhuM family protein [Brevundimonas phoenicis]|uniref:RhuM family protein n=1 Tax=unclassified Brevundimonas TaxID=2622653 RepID=UPI0039A14364
MRATIEDCSIVQTKGERSLTRQIAHCSLPVILAIGFRVRSPRGAQFRCRATNSLSESLN